MHYRKQQPQVNEEDGEGNWCQQGDVGGDSSAEEEGGGVWCGGGGYC